jgi:hypothetical protein
MGIDYATAARPIKRNQSPAVLVVQRVSAVVRVVKEKTLLYVSHQLLNNDQSQAISFGLYTGIRKVARSAPVL